jgi:hypothetical protein
VGHVPEASSSVGVVAGVDAVADRVDRAPMAADSLQAALAKAVDVSLELSGKTGLRFGAALVVFGGGGPVLWGVGAD